MSEPAPKSVAGDERPADLPAHKCGRYGHKSKRTGKLCRQNVDRGTRHCRHHAGKRREVHQAEGLIRLEAAEWTLDGHDGSDIDPKIEILRMIAFWKWKANMYGRLLHDAHAAAERLKTAFRADQPDRHSIVTVHLNRPDYDVQDDGDVLEEHPALQTARADLERVFTQGGVTAFVGHKYDVDRDGRVFAVDEGIRALVTLEERAHTMLAKCCTMAVQAKIAEARIHLAEQTGVMIQAVILGVLRDLGVIATDEHVKTLIVSHIDTVVGAPAMLAA